MGDLFVSRDGFVNALIDIHMYDIVSLSIINELHSLG
jgi:hypothetical protein